MIQDVAVGQMKQWKQECILGKGHPGAESLDLLSSRGSLFLSVWLLGPEAPVRCQCRGGTDCQRKALTLLPSLASHHNSATKVIFVALSLDEYGLCWLRVCICLTLSKFGKEETVF